MKTRLFFLTTILLLLLSCGQKKEPSVQREQPRERIGKIRRLQLDAEVRSDSLNQKVVNDKALALSRQSGNLKQIMRSLKSAVQEKLHAGDYEQCIVLSGELLDKALRTHSEEYRLYALIGLGQAYMMKSRWDEAREHLYKALELGEQIYDKNALCSVYNGLGLYHTNVTMDFREAIRFYLEGIRCARQTGNQNMYALLISNVSVVYYLTRNPEGLRYALESYKLGLQLKQEYMVFTGSSEAAQFLFMQKKYSPATFYANIAEKIMLKNNYNNEAIVYNLKAELYAVNGRLDQAVRYFTKALDESRQTQPSENVETYLGFGRLQMKTGHYKNAAELFERGLHIADSVGYTYQIAAFYNHLALCFEKTGQLEAALKNYRRYMAESEKYNAREKQKSIHELMIRYESENKEQLIKMQKLELEKKQRTFYLESSLLLLTLVVLIFAFTLNRKKEKRYLEIVRQNLQFVQREQLLLEQLNAATKESDHSKYAQSSLTEARHKQLFMDVLQLMREKQVYKDNQLSKEKLSEMLGTNRTYLSQVINEQTGLSFTHFVNTFRIEEARRILSDAENDVPLKALAAELGFNSLSTFYNAFQHSIGVPPSAYRAKSREIRQKNGHPQAEESETADTSYENV